MIRLHCVLLSWVLLHPPVPDSLPLLQNLPHPEADDGQEEEEGEDRGRSKLWLIDPQLPDEGSKCRVDEVGSLDNGEAADNAHLTRLLPSLHNFCWFYITNFSGRPKSQEKSSASTFWHLLRWALQYFYSISKFDNQTQNIQFSFSSVFLFLVKKKACVYPWVFAHLRCWCCVFFWIKWPLGKAGNSIKPAMYT